MNLWIRSQNRMCFMEVNEIRISGPKQNCIFSNGVMLGEYDSKETALKILDQIQKLMGIEVNQNGTYQELDIYMKSEMICQMRKVYVMPATEEGGN